MDRYRFRTLRKGKEYIDSKEFMVSLFWELENNKQFNWTEDAITAIAYSKDAQEFITASTDKHIKQWKIDQSYIYKSYRTGHKGIYIIWLFDLESIKLLTPH